MTLIRSTLLISATSLEQRVPCRCDRFQIELCAEMVENVAA